MLENLGKSLLKLMYPLISNDLVLNYYDFWLLFLTKAFCCKKLTYSFFYGLKLTKNFNKK
jgi:hypothetical protein